jgi:hypothetical protein
VVLERLEVSPLNTLLELDVGADAEQGFMVLAKYSDGSSRDVSDEVRWSVDNVLVGEVEQASLKVAGFDEVKAATAHVTAELEGVEGVAQLTVVAHHQSGPDQDVLLVLPYAAAGEITQPAVVSPQLGALDLLMLMDVTGSMGGSLANLRDGFTQQVVPAVRNSIPDSQFGVAAFAEFPVAPYSSGAGGGCPGASADFDQPFELQHAITSDTSAAASALAGLLNGASPIGCGGDVAEALFEGLYQSATGNGLNGPAPTNVPANHSGVGGAAFRANALHAIVSVTDIASHDVGGDDCHDNGTKTDVSINYAGTVAAVAHSRAQTKTALQAICARALGVSVANQTGYSTCNAKNDLVDMAQATGARVRPSVWGDSVRPAGCATGQCCTGINASGAATDTDGWCPLVFAAGSNGTGVSTAIAQGVVALLEEPLTATLVASGGSVSMAQTPLPDSKTIASFVTSVAAKSYELADVSQPAPTNDGTSFIGVYPGTSLRFDITGSNDFMAQTANPELFAGQLKASDGCVDEGAVPLFVLVPPLDLVAAE